MRVIHAIGWYFPDSVGGTEVYVRGLVRGLGSHGVENRVVAPAADGTRRNYMGAGCEVFRYPVPDATNRQQLWGEEADAGFSVFEDWLRAQRAEVYHQHAWIYGCGLPHLRLARRLGYRTVVTVHVPVQVCVRGTVMLGGREACDGRIDERRCIRCWAQSKGVVGLAATALAMVPVSISEKAAYRPWTGRAGTALGLRYLVGRHLRRFALMSECADRVVAPCRWLYEALALNGITREKLTLCRQGVESAAGGNAAFRQAGPALQVGVLTRWHPSKGVDTIVDAVRQIPVDKQVELVIYGHSQTAEDRAYRARVVARACRDPRIRFEDPLRREEIRARLALLDILAVPSRVMETGPLVVLEAQAAGTVVLGSRLGGIAELVKHDVNGLLIPLDDTIAWSGALAALATDGARLERLCQGIGPVRSMEAVASEMAALYSDVTESEAE